MSHPYHTLCTVSLEPFQKPPITVQFYLTSEPLPAGERDAAEVARGIAEGWVAKVTVLRVDEQGEPIRFPDEPTPPKAKIRRRKLPKQLALNF